MYDLQRLRDTTPLAGSRPISVEAVLGVVEANGSTNGPELWSPTFDESLKNKTKNVVIQEILDVEPRLSRDAVVARFVQIAEALGRSYCP